MQNFLILCSLFTATGFNTKAFKVNELFNAQDYVGFFSVAMICYIKPQWLGK